MWTGGRKLCRQDLQQADFSTKGNHQLDVCLLEISKCTFMGLCYEIRIIYKRSNICRVVVTHEKRHYKHFDSKLFDKMPSYCQLFEFTKILRKFCDCI